MDNVFRKGYAEHVIAFTKWDVINICIQNYKTLDVIITV